MKIEKDCLIKNSKCAIYSITNSVNSKIYVGSSNNVKKRIRDHISSLKNNKHHSITLQRLYNKNKQTDAYLIFSILEFCDNKDELLKTEQKWMDFFNSYNPKFGYNINQTAGSRLGIKVTEETKKKISDYWKKHKHPCIGKESVNKGKTLSQEHKDKISEANYGSKNGMYGKKLSKTTKNLMSLSHSTPIVEINKKNEIIKEFKSLTEAAEYYKMNIGGISRVCSGEYAHTHEKIFRYKDNIFPYKNKKKVYRVLDEDLGIVFSGGANEVCQFLNISRTNVYHRMKDGKFYDGYKIIF